MKKRKQIDGALNRRLPGWSAYWQQISVDLGFKLTLEIFSKLNAEARIQIATVIYKQEINETK